mmetsp:Transcript_19973/g.47570  ORF Transcript_19973/g.47570 Transcript_19973/m.47570 type:complete len:566 (+) Transcript_19973:89-1786(+)
MVDTMAAHLKTKLEPSLQVAATALSNSDHEFALSVCKQAAAVILDPRVSLMMGECYEMKGDPMEALCCYRAALSMDTSATGLHLPDSSAQRAKDKLEALVKKHGFKAAIWSGVSDKNQTSITPGLIEQRIALGRVDEAAQLYRASEPVTTRSKPAFHLQVGKAMREQPILADLAYEALTLAVNCEGGCPDAAHELGDMHYEGGRYDEALKWYGECVKASPGKALALSGIANCHKDKGDLAEAIVQYKKAIQVAPLDPTFVFNLSQAYEYVQDYDAALDLMQSYADKTPESEMTTVNHFATPLLHVKLCFAGGPKWHPHIQPLLNKIAAFPQVARAAVQGLSTHWAYYYFLSRLVKSEIAPPLEGREPLFLIGDSHVLSGAWCHVTVRGQPRYLHPKLVTGLKAWHLRKGNKFLTVSNTHECFKSLPPGTKEAIFVCGEIDCREGVMGAVEKSKYNSVQEAVDKTSEVYLQALEALSAEYEVKLHVLSICPPTNPKYKDRIEATRRFNTKLRTSLGSPVLLDIAADVTTNEGVMHPDYNCDGTHMNRNFIPLLQREINKNFSEESP